MLKDEVILPYKLEQHLIEICNKNTTYTNLLSVWNINKKMCQDVLSTVIMNYPHYTKHDTSHCESIITNIEMLLGEDTIRMLSPTDTWLLLHAAYLHDIGMVIECKKIEENWESQEFQYYLKEAEESNDETLAKNARFINSLSDKLSKKEDIIAWPVRVRRAVTILIADYYRKKHSEDSKLYIQDMEYLFQMNLGLNGLIQQRLIILLSDIARLHTKSNKEVLNLDYRTNGFNADYVHPRFIAQMLRMGDLLDADNNRFNSTNEIVFGEIPESSKNHWKKHMSARHLLITPDVIEYRADCSNPEVYRETRVFLSWLKDEIEFWTLNWKNIMPENIKGSAPRLGTCELLLNGVPDIQGLSDLRFTISSEKAFEVIEGSNIYDDKFVFIREVIQNALDACKIQLWRDILEKRYKSWIEKNVNELQPFDIDCKIYKNYSVKVLLQNLNDTHFKIVVRDNGTGMSAVQFKQVCNVGTSYLGDKKRKEEVDTMPKWLRPTAGFGIGLQSIFLIAEEFEIYSKSSGNEGIYAKVSSGRKNGYVQVSASDKLECQGTEICVVLPRDLNFNYSLGGNTYNYVEKYYDPFSEEENILYYKIWDVLRGTMQNTYFPVELYFDDELVDVLEPLQFQGLEKSKEKNKYSYIINPDYSMDLWDNHTYTKMKIRLRESYQQYNSRCYFKGMETDNQPRLKFKGILCEVDFYGLDTRRTLSLDRKKIKKEASQEIQEIINSAIEFYIRKIEETILTPKKHYKENECNQIYTYWCMCPFKKKIELLKRYKDIFEKIKVDVDVLRKNESVYEIGKLDFKEVVEDLNKMVTVKNISKFLNRDPRKEGVNVELIKNILDTHKIDFPIVVVDRNFTEALAAPYFEKVSVISTENNYMYLTIHSSDENKLPQTYDKTSRELLITSLLKKEEKKYIYGLVIPSMRRCIIGIKEYETICTSLVPFGIYGEEYSSIGYIISPFTLAQWNENKCLSVDKFTEVICESMEFQNLLNHTYEHQIKDRKNSKEVIKGKYIELIRELYSYSANKHN